MEHDEKHPHPKFGGNRLMGPKIWPYEYLMFTTGPIENSVISLVPNSYVQGQFTLLSVVLIRCSCSHIRAPMNQFMLNLLCEGLSSCSTEIYTCTVIKC